jgi:beta-galactosidase
MAIPEACGDPASLWIFYIIYLVCRIINGVQMRPKIVFGLVMVLIFSGLFSCRTKESPNARVVKNFNDDWKFYQGDIEGAEGRNFNDTVWTMLDLPHDWSVKGPYDPDLASCTGYLPGGIGWYRKTFDVAIEDRNKKIALYFMGIYRNGEVFINGYSLGMRPNGYISTYYDLSPYIEYGEKNVIAVRVDHSQSIDSRWYTGSGIYRDVLLIYTDPIHIEHWGNYFTTPVVTDKQAIARIQTSVKNTSNEQASVEIVNEILDNSGRIISTSSKEINVAVNEMKVVTQELKIERPNLWSVDNPYLYKLKTSIYQGKILIDSAEEKVGLRTLNFDADKGFSLNGKPMKIKGVCLHHDSGCLGSAVLREVWQRRLTTLKSLGCNAVRTSHNPRSPVFYTLCDELGLLVLDEAFDEWEFPKKKWIEGWNVGTPGFQGPSEFFDDWAEIDLRDMVLRDRNHPSVFMWSIGNEVDYPNDPYSHPILDKEGIRQQHTWGYLPDQPNAERLGGIAKKLAAVVREYDPSRPVTAGLAGPVMSNETEYPGVLDVVGYNYTEYRYAMDHKTYPDRILYGSENGHSFRGWKAVRDNEYIFGQFLWTGIDYLGEALPWPSRGFGSGLLNLAGFKKARAYFRESLWSDKPTIYCGTYQGQSNDNADRLSIDAPPVWNYKDGETVRVVVYTNCQKVQLHLNGQKIGESKEYDDERGILYWDVPYKEGSLEAIGTNANQSAVHYAITTSQKPHAIKTKAWNKSISHDRGVAQIEIQIVDQNENPVFGADNEISCTTTGPVKLLGLESSNPEDMGDYTDNKQSVYQGRMIAYLQANGKKGIARITFSSPELIDSVVEIKVK